jgi:uncharacterized protein (DUF433 family)
MQVAEYVQRREGDWYVGASRVRLYSVIAAWKQELSPEDIQAGFPHLALVEVYGSITYYLAHQAELDASFHETKALAEEQRATAEAANPAFYADMRARIACVRPAVVAEMRAAGMLTNARDDSERQGNSKVPSQDAPAV